MKNLRLGLLALIAPLLPLPPAHASDPRASGVPMSLPEISEMRFRKTGDPLTDWNSKRRWISVEGTHMNATILEAYDYGIKVRLENGTTQVVILARFSEADQRFIEEWKEMSRFFNLGFVPGIPTPAVTDADIDAVGISSQGTRHETRHFRITSDIPLHADTFREISQVFEATYHAVAANPFGIAISVPPDQKIPVRLFRSMERYYSAGGPVGSGGVYNTVRREILIPLPQAGLISDQPAVSGGIVRERRSEYWTKVSSILDPWVLVHETTHALTHDWLGAAPLWFNEGLAEYIASMTYLNGRMTSDHRNSNIQHRLAMRFPAGESTIRFVPPIELANMPNATFRLNPGGYQDPPTLPTFQSFNFHDLSRNDPIEPETVRKSNQSQLPQLSQRDRSYLSAVNYSSALAAVYHLAESGQHVSVRRYLSDLLYFEWERLNYLKEFDEAAKTFSMTVNTTIQRYQSDLALHNETDPSKPAPSVPETIEAPEILREPRSPEALSRESARRTAAARHLQLPAIFSVSQFQ
ncbi:MAG: hypothetical protein AAGF67_08265 [Verrucomicrobiota bacterium]